MHQMGLAEAQAKADAAMKAYRENDQSTEAMVAAQDAQRELMLEKKKAERKAKRAPIVNGLFITIVCGLFGGGLAWLVSSFW